MCSNYSHMGKFRFHFKGNGFNFDEEAPESETLLEILEDMSFQIKSSRT